MTDFMLDQPPPGPQLDLLIARRVMGWKINPGDLIPPYSIDIAAAWTVVDHLDHLICLRQVPRDGEWLFACTFIEGGEYAWGLTAPHAICRAALKAVDEAPQ